jgi:hypothetical protein
MSSKAFYAVIAGAGSGTGKLGNTGKYHLMAY